MERPVTPADTDPVVFRRQVEQWRSMTPGERAELANRLSVDVARLSIAGIRFRHPGATAEEVRYELARRRYGEHVARPLLPLTATR